MSLKIDTDGLQELRLKLQRLKDVPDVANKHMAKYAIEMRDIARLMAPRDHGNLEHAIKYRFQGTQGAGGRFVKGGGSYVVYIDNNELAHSEDGKPTDKKVGDYAWFVHEHLYPFGEPVGNWGTLGPKSRAKQEQNPHIRVGGRFVERAGVMMQNRVHRGLMKVVFQYVERVSRSMDTNAEL